MTMTNNQFSVALGAMLIGPVWAMSVVTGYASGADQKHLQEIRIKAEVLYINKTCGAFPHSKREACIKSKLMMLTITGI